MCLGVPGRVVELDGEHDARVDLDGTVRDISLAVLTFDGRGVAPGDWVMCHTGFAVEVVDPVEAESIVALRRSMRHEVEPRAEARVGGTELAPGSMRHEVEPRADARVGGTELAPGSTADREGAA